MAQLEAKIITVLKSASTEEAAHSEDLQKQLSTTQQELASSHAHMHNVERQLADAKVRESSQTAALEQLNVQLASVREELAAFQAQVQRAEESIAEAQARETEQAAANKDLEEQLSSVRTELAGSHGKLQEKEEQLAEARGREAEKAAAIEQMQMEKVTHTAASHFYGEPTQSCKFWHCLKQMKKGACSAQLRRSTSRSNLQPICLFLHHFADWSQILFQSGGFTGAA